MSKVYQFGWVAWSSKEAKAGRVSVKDYCLSAAEAKAEKRVKNEYGLSNYEVRISLQRVVSG